MTPSFYREQWHALKEQAEPEALTRLAEQVALTFLDRHFFNDCFDEDYIEILCEMATSFDKPELNRIGAAALFGIVVESLCDDFEELQTEAYNRLMATIVMFCRRLPNGDDLHQRMNGFGLDDFQDLFLRVERLRKTSCNFRDLPTEPKKIFLMSRVTLGADIAVTSVLVQRLARLYPEAEQVLIGGSKLRTMFGGNPRLRIRELAYTRRGGLLERLTSWFAVLDILDAEMDRLSPADVLVVDPDSRLSQLGVMPMIKDSNYLFFNSRGSNVFPQKLSISELANYWLNQVTGSNDFAYPALWLEREVTARAKTFVEELRATGAKQIVAVNFGVGGNSRKRVDGDFEASVLHRILETPGTVILLDKGFGKEELTRTGALIGELDSTGVATAEGSFDTWPGERFAHGLIGIEAGIGEAAALIGASDEFIGYDSACQHIAAALEVPVCTIFAGSNNTRFVRRWRPFGLGKSEVIHVDTLTHPPVFDRQAIVLRLMHARRDK